MRNLHIHSLQKVYILRHPMSLTVALLSLLLGFALILMTALGLYEHAPLARFLPGPAAEQGWPYVLFLGGAFVTFGLVRGNPSAEASGMFLLMLCYLMQAFAVAETREVQHFWISIVSIGILSISCGARSVFLMWAGSRKLPCL